jgi:hypothetical protein
LRDTATQAAKPAVGHRLADELKILPQIHAALQPASRKVAVFRVFPPRADDTAAAQVF